MQFRAIAASLALLGATQATYAAPFPLPASATPTTPAQELNAPFTLSDGLTQKLITNRISLLPKGLPSNIAAWDMTAFDDKSANIYIPGEAGAGGVFRYNLKSGKIKVLLNSDGGPRTSDPALFDPLVGSYTSLDPNTWTPWKSLIIGEEDDGGRLFEIMNPKSNGTIQVRWLTSIPAVAHEGLRFDKDGNLYFIDEDNSGSIYKFVPTKKKDLSRGQSFVLKVNAYTGVASENWNSVANTAAVRTGAATWVPITDKNGVPLTETDPFVYVTANSGAMAANELNATPYGRPEDITFKTLASGNEAIFFNATSEHTMYSIELTGSTAATVRVFANRNTIDLATGLPVGTALANPDNAETDAIDGSIYIIEDNNPGDIWKAIDADNNGVAESMGRWVSLGVVGSEPTGLERDPNDPKRFFVNIQHPTSTNDATWEIRLP